MGFASVVSAIRRAVTGRRPVLIDGAHEAQDPRAVRAGYDAAGLGGQNAQHWAAADALDADAANSLAVRQRLSQRARYELANNGQGKGIQLTHANYVVGPGPKLRMQTGSPGFNAMVEARWNRWAKSVKLARRLRTAVKAKVSDGEAFIVIVRNPRLGGEVKLGLKPVECEQVTTPYLGARQPGKIDGIDYDEFGNPTHYHVLRYHPGGAWSGLDPAPERIPARFVLHLFREDRPGQHRGVSELHPSLNLYAQGRRYREATVAAAENLANFSILLKTQQAPNEGPDLVRPLSTLPLEKSMMVALPYGFDVYQAKAEQPGAKYDEFIRSQICEQARPLNMPYNIAAADSSGYSFSGGKLDHLTYFVSLDVEQSEIEEEVLDPLFEVWFAEAALRYGWTVPREPAPNHAWDWPRKPVIDDRKTAGARRIALSTGMASLRRLYAEDGLDFEEELPAMAKDYGVSEDDLRGYLLSRNLGVDLRDAGDGDPPAGRAAGGRAAARNPKTNGRMPAAARR